MKIFMKNKLLTDIIIDAYLRSERSQCSVQLIDKNVEE